VDALYFSPIDAEKGTWLEREFEEQEVWEVVCNLNGDKASGPNGFTMASSSFFFFFSEMLRCLETRSYGSVFRIP
jgi:hypothetical protein